MLDHESATNISVVRKLSFETLRGTQSRRIKKHCVASQVSSRDDYQPSVVVIIIVKVIPFLFPRSLAFSSLRKGRECRGVVSMPIISRPDGRSVSDYWIGYRGGKEEALGVIGAAAATATKGERMSLGGKEEIPPPPSLASRDFWGSRRLCRESSPREA